MYRLKTILLSLVAINLSCSKEAPAIDPKIGTYNCITRVDKLQWVTPSGLFTSYFPNDTIIVYNEGDEYGFVGYKLNFDNDFSFKVPVIGDSFYYLLMPRTIAKGNFYAHDSLYFTKIFNVSPAIQYYTYSYCKKIN